MGVPAGGGTVAQGAPMGHAPQGGGVTARAGGHGQATALAPQNVAELAKYPTFEHVIELIRQQRVRWDLTHHNDTQTIFTALQTVLFQQLDNLLRFTHSTYERHHDFHVGQAHLITHFFQCTTFQLKTVTE